jgi:hypothetical protein
VVAPIRPAFVLFILLATGCVSTETASGPMLRPYRQPPGVADSFARITGSEAFVVHTHEAAQRSGSMLAPVMLHGR